VALCDSRRRQEALKAFYGCWANPGSRNWLHSFVPLLPVVPEVVVAINTTNHDKPTVSSLSMIVTMWVLHNLRSLFFLKIVLSTLSIHPSLPMYKPY